MVKMKALLIVALMGMAQPHEVIYENMDQCMAAKAVIEKQDMVDGAACVPHQELTKQIEPGLKMMLEFIKGMKQRNRCDDMKQQVRLWECMSEEEKERCTSYSRDRGCFAEEDKQPAITEEKYKW
tara:strand:- start:9280 stop:9654 length:375 start_codon:yes stop_codon:yes gene_type:complete